jgi:hypothetical protein
MQYALQHQISNKKIYQNVWIATFSENEDDTNRQLYVQGFSHRYVYMKNKTLRFHRNRRKPFGMNNILQ